MFEAYRDELQPRFKTPACQPQTRQVDPGIEADYDEIPLEEFVARDLRSNAQPAPAPTSEAAEAPDAEMAGVDLNGFLGLLGTLLSNNGTAPIALPENSQEPDQPLFAEDLVMQFVARRRLNIPRPFGRLGAKTSELIGNQPPRRKVAAMGGVVLAAVAAFGMQSHQAPIEQKITLLTAPASLINQGAVFGSIDLKSQATVRIPVADFKMPLRFMKDNKAVEPATTLNDTISLTLAPTTDKKGNSLPIATIKNGDTFEVDRSKISVNASFDNYLGLNVDCSKPSANNRFCVDGSPVKLQAGGNLKAATAKQLNDMLTARGPGFDNYYQGVKAKLAVADLTNIEQGACGTDIYRLADAVISSILHQQSVGAKIHFIQNSHYPSISQVFADNFTGLVTAKAFSIEQGDSKNAIPNSLQVTCQVTNPKGAK